MSKPHFSVEDVKYLGGVIAAFEENTKAATEQSLSDNGLVYPPHFARDPLVDQLSPFDPIALRDNLYMLAPQIPPNILDLAPDPDEHTTIAHLEGYFRKLREIFSGRAEKNMYSGPNIGDRPDWFTDAVFGQQQFTGVNPTTISAAATTPVPPPPSPTPDPSLTWFDVFSKAATGNATLEAFLKDNKATFFVQDYSYFRTVLRVSDDKDLIGYTPDGKPERYLGASVALFHLEPTFGNGMPPQPIPLDRLYPAAIIIDWKGSLEKSVCIFNPRYADPTRPESWESWPWRYAKTCVSTADWLRHEVEIHLVQNHFAIEAIMVGITRTLPRAHPIRRLIEPHWAGTRPVNIGARRVLVPAIIMPNVALRPDQLFKFINEGFRNFDFSGRYVPRDFEKRGFPVGVNTDGQWELEDNRKYGNYGYARNILPMWSILREFVAAVLGPNYTDGSSSIPSDARVASDKELQRFCTEMVKNIGLGGFPAEIKTFKDLVDMATMSIHIATVGHAAINYLQDYYQVFVPNRPAALYKPLPIVADELAKYTEKHLFEALPVRATRNWLISAQLPFLLSFTPPDDFTLSAYAERESQGPLPNSLWPDADKPFVDPNTTAAALVLKERLRRFGVKSRDISLELDNTTPRYRVLDPELATSSIIL